MILLLGLCVVVLGLVSLALFGAAGAAAPRPLQEQVVLEGDRTAKIVQIELRGIILADAGGLLMPGISYRSLLDQLKQAREDEACKGVLLRCLGLC